MPAYKIFIPIPNARNFTKAVSLRHLVHGFRFVFSANAYKIRKDEKNIRYREAIKLFGDLNTVCTALTGISGRIIEALRLGPLEYDELRGRAKLGKGKQEKSIDKLADTILKRFHSTGRRIGQRRIGSAQSQMFSSNMADIQILDYLISKDVIRRKWHLPRCRHCDGVYWVHQLEVDKKVSCPGCGNDLHLKDSVKLGYELNELINKALDEGFTPIPLTARFLKRLTSSGFIWLPGMKIEKDGKEMDFDILAACDGKLVAGECKTLPKGKIVWDEIQKQLVIPINSAKNCGFKMFFVSSLVNKYPVKFKEQIRNLAGKEMPVLFLTSKDLQIGYREVKDDDGNSTRLDLSKIYDQRWKKKWKEPKKKGARTIYF